jgi:hypothetical protein
MHTWNDAAKGALEACEDELGFRRGVAQGEEEGLVDMLAAQLDPELVEQRRRRQFVQSRRPIREDGLSQLRALARLDAEAQLERRETVIADLDESPDGVALFFEGKEIRFPAVAAPEVQAIFDSDEPFRLADLPGELDTDGRLVLARRLVREGLLRIS